MVADPIARRMASPRDALGGVRAAIGRPRELAELALETVKGTAAMRGLLRPTPRSSLNGRIGPHRRWDWAHAQLSDVKAVRGAVGGTINDVVLAVISRGFRDLLISRDEDPARLVVRTLVPVSVRRCISLSENHLSRRMD